MEKIMLEKTREHLTTILVCQTLLFDEEKLVDSLTKLGKYLVQIDELVSANMDLSEDDGNIENDERLKTAVQKNLDSAVEFISECRKEFNNHEALYKAAKEAKYGDSK
jgi:hypothetical protein